jgi:hypothetical protein
MRRPRIAGAAKVASATAARRLHVASILINYPGLRGNDGVGETLLCRVDDSRVDVNGIRRRGSQIRPRRYPYLWTLVVTRSCDLRGLVPAYDSGTRI